jgi:Lysylphosphatidylglycerol synthase TM region
MIVALQGSAFPVKLFRALTRWQGVLPALVSAGLVCWLLWRFPPAELASRAALLDWQLLLPATGLMVLGLYFWDAVCLRWLFRRLGYELSYGTVLHARGRSYLLGAFQYELGNALLAWQLASVIPMLRTLAGCLLRGCHDVAVLLVLGLVGALLSPDNVSRTTLLVCLAGLGTLLVAALAAAMVRRSREQDLAGWLRAWRWWHSAQLCLLRAAYYGIIFIYAAYALWLCGVAVDAGILVSTIPLVMLADGLPISIAGLGTRETTLLYLLSPEQPAIVLAFSFTWSAGLMAGRLLLGLGHTWLPRRMSRETP